MTPSPVHPSVLRWLNNEASCEMYLRFWACRLATLLAGEEGTRDQLNMAVALEWACYATVRDGGAHEA